MSIFKELAAGVRGDMSNFKEQAQELMRKREELRLRGEKNFALFREHQAEVEAGLKEMDDALRDMEGGNSKNAEGSDVLSETFRNGNGSNGS